MGNTKPTGAIILLIVLWAVMIIPLAAAQPPDVAADTGDGGESTAAAESESEQAGDSEAEDSDTAEDDATLSLTGDEEDDAGSANSAEANAPVTTGADDDDDILGQGITVTSLSLRADGDGDAGSGQESGAPAADRLEDLSLKTDIDTEDPGKVEAPPAADRFKFPEDYETAAQPPPAPKPKPAPKPQPAPPVAEEPEAGTATKDAGDTKDAAAGTDVADGDGAEAAEAEDGGMKLAELLGEEAGSDTPAPSEWFTAADRAGADAEAVVLNTETVTDEGADSASAEAGDSPVVGVINTHKPQDGSRPSLNEVLNGGDGEEELGSNVPGMDPMRVAGIFLLCLALVVIAVWFARKRGRNLFSGGREQSLSVMENINLGAGRQITIVEMGEYALVLGVTAQSINTLDKVPLTQLGSSYQGTVNSIIARQQNAMPDEWQRSPSFKAPGQLAAGLNPAAGSGKSAGTIYGPQGRRVNVGELRRNRAGGRDAEPARPVSSLPRNPQSAQRSKDELIGRVRQQLDRIEH